jgi:hypothetical protein
MSDCTKSLEKSVYVHKNTPEVLYKPLGF